MTGEAGRRGAGAQVEPDPQRLAIRSALVVAVGTVLSGLALILGLVALNAAYAGTTTTTATPWLVTLLACAGLMGLICVVQQRLWRIAAVRWETGASTVRFEQVSWWLHVASYPVVVVGIFAGISASHDVGFAGGVSTWATLALVPLIAAQVIGAVQLVRTDGPPGTVPTHVRRLAARIERSRHED